MHHGIYVVGYPTLTRNGHFMAAVLACGDKAALSHVSAAVLWASLSNEGKIRVTKRAGIPVTTPARTLIDLADVAPRRTLERALDEAEFLRLDCSGLAPRHGRTAGGGTWSVTPSWRRPAGV